MFPKEHFFYSLAFSLFLFLIFPKINLLYLLVFLFSSVLIDVDHYLYFVYKTKKFGINDSYKWFIESGKKFNKLSNSKKKKVFHGIFIFHGIEAFILVSFLVFYFPIFISVLSGFVFHQVLDLIDISKKRTNETKLVSFIYSIYDTKNKKYVGDLA